MSSTAKQKHLLVEDLSGNVSVLIECGKQLKTAPFKDNGKFETIDDTKLFEEASRGFRQIKSTKASAWAISTVAVANLKKPDCNLIAWRFPKRTTLTIPLNVTLDVIPCEISGTPTVGGIPVKMGKSIHLREDVEVQPSFTCLVRVYG